MTRYPNPEVEECNIPSQFAKDAEFALEISTTYNLPQENILTIVNYFRDAFDSEFNYKHFEKAMLDEQTMFKIERSILLNFEVEEIIIKTKGGDQLNLNRCDPDLKLLLTSIESLRKKYIKFHPSSNKKIREWLLDGYIWFMDQELIKSAYHISQAQRYTIIGKFLVYFNVKKRSELVRDKIEFEDTARSDRNYDEYLEKIVKSRMKTIKKKYTNKYQPDRQGGL